jgi:hypothetical protein
MMNRWDRGAALGVINRANFTLDHYPLPAKIEVVNAALTQLELTIDKAGRLKKMIPFSILTSINWLWTAQAKPKG